MLVHILQCVDELSLKLLKILVIDSLSQLHPPKATFGTECRSTRQKHSQLAPIETYLFYVASHY